MYRGHDDILIFFCQLALLCGRNLLNNVFPLARGSVRRSHALKYLKSFLSAICRILLASAFWIAVNVFHRVEVHGLQNDNGLRPAYFAMCHRRDLDPMVEIPIVLGHRGWRALAGDVRFAMRSDAFSQGFLARIVLRPRWFARFLRLIPLTAILRGLGIFPLENVHMRPAEVWIRDALAVAGDVEIEDALTPVFLQQVVKYPVEHGGHGGQAKGQNLSHLLSWRYQQSLQAWQGVDIFREPLRSQMKRFVMTEARKELVTIARYIHAGGSLWGAPEGGISSDGHIGMVTASAHRFVRDCPPELCIVPLSISYDFMTTRRAGIFVHVAPVIEHAPLLAQQALDEQLRNAWRQHMHFTCTQLASGFLVQASRTGMLQFTVDDITRSVEQQARMLAQAGRLVDTQLLHSRSARKLVIGYIRYAQRQGLIRSNGRTSWIPTIGSLTVEVRPGEYGYMQNPLGYAWNELQELLSVPTSSASPASGISPILQYRRQDRL